MVMGWDSVLKLAAIGSLLMIFLSGLLIIILQEINYDPILLSLLLIASIFSYILLRTLWHAKKFLL